MHKLVSTTGYGFLQISFKTRFILRNKVQFKTLIRHLVNVKILPEEPFVDDKLSIIVSGLKPQQNITVKSSVTEGKASFSASACFVSDSDGKVCIHKQRSVSGTYTGVDCMGLFWSMIPDPGKSKGPRYIKRDVTTPQIVNLSVFDGHLSLKDCSEENVITTKQIKRRFLRKTVTRKEIRHGKLRGTMFIPQGDGPFPGIIDMFGSAGGLIEYRAAMLASRGGFITYALPYFGYDDLPEILVEVDFNYLKETVKWFSSHPKVNKTGIGVSGVSKGGEIALMLAITCPEVKSVVNINGPPFCSFLPLGPFTNVVECDLADFVLQEDGYNMKKALSLNLSTDKIFKVWKSDATVLYIVGEDDQSVDPLFAQMLFDSYPEDQSHKLIIKKYENAGHLIEPPYLPICFRSYHKVFNMVLVWGGKGKDHAKADEDSWQLILDFFRYSLSSTNNKSNNVTSHL